VANQYGSVSEAVVLSEEQHSARPRTLRFAELLHPAMQRVVGLWLTGAPEQFAAADDSVVVPWCCG
jgi:hypothetical protein